jgi:hypothetical protein
MTTAPSIHWFSQKLALLARCDRGNVAIIFALALIPLVGAVGAAIDYSRAATARTAMQTALDAAALILSKKAQMLPLAVFKANFHYPDAKNPTVDAIYSTTASGAFSLKMTASASVDTTLTAIWQPTIDIGTSTEVVWGILKIELALALDNTGSMASNGKMTELKKAATQLLEKLKPLAKKPGDVKVAIIPFATDVNVGTGYVNAGWIRWDEWEERNGSCMNSGNEVKDRWGNRIPTKTACTETDPNATWKLNARSTWNGCVADRDQSNDTNNAVPASKATRYVAHQADKCPVSMMPLNYDWNALTKKIDAMNPVGNTNVTIGLQVAYQTLSPVAPFNASSAPSDELAKVIVLLTDGDNTQNRWYSNNNNSRIDKRTELACSNVKADKKLNIEIYTIRVIDGNSGLLQKCASDTSKYSDVQDPKNLEQVFAKIAQDLSKLRLAK